MIYTKRFVLYTDNEDELYGDRAMAQWKWQMKKFTTQILDFSKNLCYNKL